jgi:hypothetical protein
MGAAQPYTIRGITCRFWLASRALRNGAPFKDWVLPTALERVRRKLTGSDDGDRQMVKILAAVLTDGLPDQNNRRGGRQRQSRGELVRNRADLIHELLDIKRGIGAERSDDNI